MFSSYQPKKKKVKKNQSLQLVFQERRKHGEAEEMEQLAKLLLWQILLQQSKLLAGRHDVTCLYFSCRGRGRVSEKILNCCLCKVVFRLLS